MWGHSGKQPSAKQNASSYQTCLQRLCFPSLETVRNQCLLLNPCVCSNLVWQVGLTDLQTSDYFLTHHHVSFLDHSGVLIFIHWDYWNCHEAGPLPSLSLPLFHPHSWAQRVNFIKYKTYPNRRLQKTACALILTATLPFPYTSFPGASPHPALPPAPSYLRASCLLTRGVLKHPLPGLSYLP